MGYYTCYKVEDLEGNDLSKEISLFVEGDEDASDYFNGCEVQKWYDCEEDLKRFSLLPENKGKVIYCHGAGETNGDLWDLYVKDGKSQRCEAVITYPEFDETKLK